MHSGYYSPDFRSDEIHVTIRGDSLLMSFFNMTVSTMERPLNDLMDRTLLRIRKKFEKKKVIKKKGIKAVEPVESDGAVYIEKYGVRVETTNLHNSDWVSDMEVFIDSLRMRIIVDAPNITALSSYPRKPILINSPIIAKVSAEYTDRIDYVWCIETDQKLEIVCKESIFIPNESHVGLRIKLYCTPSRKKLVNTSLINNNPPSNSSMNELIYGRTTTLYFNCNIELSKISKTLQIRKDFLSIISNNNQIISSTPNEHNKSNIRIMTYNILADSYATSDYAKKVLYSYIKNPLFLELDYRSQIILQELIIHNSDIICLQECDSKAFEDYYEPYLSKLGYSGHYTGKTGNVPEGCAFFSRNNTFTLLQKYDFHLKNALSSDVSLQDLFSIRPDLFDIACSKLGTTSQIEILQYKNNPKHIFIIANTHLFYHPGASYIRLLQTHVIIQKISQLKSEILFLGLENFLMKENITNNDYVSDVNLIDISDGNIEVSVVFAGDLNSTAEDGVIEYLSSGVILPEHDEWKSMDTFKWGKAERKAAAALAVEGEGEGEIHTASSKSYENNDNDNGYENVPITVLSSQLSEILPVLTHDLGLFSATGFPTYTNFTRGFQDLLDYIFIPCYSSSSSSLNVVSVAPFPSYDVLIEEIALPSEVFPSDHLSVVIDLSIN
eukprot:gene2814-5536_t